jgi:hypothetical protein
MVVIPLDGKALLPNNNSLPGSGYLKGSRDRSDPS